VARWSAAAPFGQLRAAHVLGLLAIVLAGLLVRSRRSRVALVAAAVVVLCQPGLALATGPTDWNRELAPGVRLWRGSGTAVLAVSGARGGDLLRSAHDAGVGRIDLLVLTRRSRATAAAADILLARVPARAVVAPDGTRLQRATATATAGEVLVGTLVVALEPDDKGLAVRVRRDRR
jgi:hypothetical protein